MTRRAALRRAIDAVLLDLGGVLVHDVLESMLLGPNRLPELRTLDPEAVRLAFGKAWKRFAHRPETNGDPADVQERLFWQELLAGLPGPSLSVESIVARTDDFLCPVDPMIFDLLRRVRASGVTLAVLSNQVTFLRRRLLARFSLTDLIDPGQMTWSCDADVQSSKSSPDLKPFAVAYRKLGRTEKSRVLFVDDRPLNCLMACHFGLTAVQTPAVEGNAAYLERLLERLGVFNETPGPESKS